MLLDARHEARDEGRVFGLNGSQDQSPHTVLYKLFTRP